MRAIKPRPTVASSASTGHKPPPPTTCAQRIEVNTVRDRRHVTLGEIQVLDAENLFKAHDADSTGILCRGSLTEALRAIGLEEKLGEKSFRGTARLLFDAHSADSHFLSMPEWKQMYYMLSTLHPELLPRRPPLKISVLRAKGLPPLDINGKSDPFAVCQVVGKDKSRMQTKHIEKTLEPVWNEELDDRYCYEPGDTLEFGVYDFDKGSRCELIGRARLPSSEFYKEGGFDDELKLSELPKDFRQYAPMLRVRVSVTALEPKPERPEPEASEPPVASKVSIRAVAHLAFGGIGGGPADALAAAMPVPALTPAAGAAPAVVVAE